MSIFYKTWQSAEEKKRCFPFMHKYKKGYMSGVRGINCDKTKECVKCGLVKVKYNAGPSIPWSYPSSWSDEEKGNYEKATDGVININ